MPPSPSGRRYERCAANGCIRTPRPFSRYCAPHYRTLERTRDLNGRVLTKGELRGHHALAAEFVERNSEHPAVLAVLSFLAELLAPTDRATFLGRELTRLRTHGATPEAMLVAMLAVYGWTEYAPRPLADRCFDLNIGRAVLATVPAARRISRAGRSHFVRVRPGHAEALGAHLREHLGLFALVATRSIVKRLEGASVDTRQAMREALALPFQVEP